ncbi:MAG: radical SAM protein [Clostridia bacterium]|nr:radical SAM protein [Clostridia bacterium]
MSDRIKLARADLHFYEEPIISGTRGSGAIFFSGCSLGCVFCQNREISHGGFGEYVSEGELADIMLRLYGRGAHNINLVTPTHFVPSIAGALTEARKRGLEIPVVYNTSSYESASCMEMLSPLIDVYLPDLKYHTKKSAGRYSYAEDLPEIAKRNIDIMYESRGPVCLDKDGLITSGVVVRVLLLPAHVAEAKLILKYLHTRYGDNIFISIMSQYTPISGLTPPLDRRVSVSEYAELCDYASTIGIKNAFVQDRESADSSFTPKFDLTGVKPI